MSTVYMKPGLARYINTDSKEEYLPLAVKSNNTRFDKDYTIRNSPWQCNNSGHYFDYLGPVQLVEWE